MTSPHGKDVEAWASLSLRHAISNISKVCVEVLRPSQLNGGHVERGQFTLPHIYWAGLVL